MFSLFKPKPSLMEELMAYFLNPIFLLGIGTLFVVVILIAFMDKSRRRACFEEEELSYPLPKINLDMTPAELEQYDGKRYDGRTLVAINGTIYDITGDGPTRASVRLSGRSLFYPSGSEGWQMAQKLEEKYYIVGQLKQYTRIKKTQSQLDSQALENLLLTEMESPPKRFESAVGYANRGQVCR